MEITQAEALVYLTPRPIVAALTFATAAVFFFVGRLIHRHRTSGRERDGNDDQDLLVGGVLSMLALLLAFLLSMAVDRYQARAETVGEEAAAVGSAYLWSRTLADPQREQARALLIEYTAARLEIGRARDVVTARTAFAESRAALQRLWEVTGAGHRWQRDDITASSLGAVADLDNANSRHFAAARGHLPLRAYALIGLNLAVAAALLGYFSRAADRVPISLILLNVTVVSLNFIIDIDRPVGGPISTPMVAMERVHQQMLEAAGAGRNLPAATPSP